MRYWNWFIGVTILILVSVVSGIVYLAWGLLDGNKNIADVRIYQGDTIHLHDEPLVDTPKSIVRKDKVFDPSEDFEVEEVEEREESLTVLALGLDARGDYLRGRTDAIVLISIYPKKESVSILSIPRDSYVQIGNTGKYDKINHAYPFGGVEVTKTTVENLVGVDIDHYVVFNFTSFMRMVDALGGVEIDVPYTFTEQDSKDRQGAIRIEKGRQLLDGEKALAYARMRKSDPEGDIGRGKRQQEVILALADKLLSFKSLSNFSEVYDIIKESMATDVSITDIPSLLKYLKGYSDINSFTLKGGGTYINGVYYYRLDEEHLNYVRDHF